MKRFLPLMLCLLILAACADASDAARKPPFTFTAENYPRVDGSTAAIPLIGAVESVLLNKSRSEITVNVRKTSGAYTALANNEADILFVYDGGDETRLKVEADELFETVPIGRDALIFVVNSDNPIDNLTSDQVRKIFSGEYTSWSEVGGSDTPIRAYQRGIGSGSQALMDKLVMQNRPMANPATVPVVGNMGELIDVVAGYSGGPTAIGYNVYYYVTEMKNNDRIKILSIDGISPSYETIQSSAYPFISDFYSVIRKNEPADSPARALHEWMLSAEAQNLMASENYVALNADPGAATPRADGKFSFYPEGEAPEYFPGTNRYKLEPSDKYGQLYFYLGKMLPEDFSLFGFFGLCTADGKIVTDPIYTMPELLIDSEGNRAYLCCRADVERQIIETIPLPGGRFDRLTKPAILLPIDGSWILELDDVAQFRGFTGGGGAIMNADFLAANIGGKWGTVNLLGETLIPFGRDSYKGIYPDPNKDAEHALTYIAATGNRFMRSERGIPGDFDGPFSLYDGELNLIATGLMGSPHSKTANRIITSTFGPDSTTYIYTLDGELLHSFKRKEEGYTITLPWGEFVHIYTEDGRLLTCDADLSVLYEFKLDWDSAFGTYEYMSQYPGVLCRTDSTAQCHRTYLPDGTRLVTWYDPDINGIDK